MQHPNGIADSEWNQTSLVRPTLIESETRRHGTNEHHSTAVHEIGPAAESALMLLRNRIDDDKNNDDSNGEQIPHRLAKMKAQRLITVQPLSNKEDPSYGHVDWRPATEHPEAARRQQQANNYHRSVAIDRRQEHKT